MASSAADSAATAADGVGGGAAAVPGGNVFRDFVQQQHQQDARAPIVLDDALPVYWMKQEKDGSWQPLRRKDNVKVEAAFQAGATEPVSIEGGRYEVDLAQREVRSVYWDKDSRRVLRTSWFSRPATNLPGGGGLVPYEEADAAAIEELYQAALDETVRSLAAGSFLPPSQQQPGGDSLSASTSSGIGASASASTSTTSISCAGKALLRKELPLADGVNKVVITIKECSAGSSSGGNPGAGASSSGPAKPPSGGSSRKLSCDQQQSKLGLAVLPGVEIEVMQQKMSYGVGFLHNRILRRGLESAAAEAGGGSSSSSTGAGAGAATLDDAAAAAAAGGGGLVEEDDEFDREPSHLVFVVHGIGEKIWASDMIQGMLSLRTSVEVMRRNTLEQQIRIMETPPPAAAASSASCRGARACSKTGAAAAGAAAADASGGDNTAPPPSESTEAETETADSSTTGGSTSGSSSSSKAKKTRPEFVPVEWFDAIREDESALTRRIQRVTLPTVPLFRQLANDCVMDVLLYMNPSYRQRILKAVGDRMNAAYAKFRQTHPGFSGKVSVVGHSLGSVILFDLLAHQRGHQDDRVLNPLDAAVHYPQLSFPVDLFMTMGSPIGMFLTVREQELPPSFRFPTVERFYNVFHPYDPVAYRIEPILQPAMARLEPALVPHHATGTGEKTFVTKAREHRRIVTGSLSALSSSVSSGAKSLLGSLSSLAVKPALAFGGLGGTPASITAAATAASGTSTEGASAEVAAAGLAIQALAMSGSGSGAGSAAPLDDSATAAAEPKVEALLLNQGRRVDYAIQEGLGESLNEYISAISSHSCYFGHKDVAYMLARLLHRLDDKGAPEEEPQPQPQPQPQEEGVAII